MHKVDVLQNAKRPYSPPKYFTRDEYDDAAIGKRCPLTGDLAVGGFPAYCRASDIRQEKRAAFLRECMLPVFGEIKRGDQAWKKNVSLGKLKKSSRAEPLTPAQRQALSRAKYQPKKTSEEKAACKAAKKEARRKADAERKKKKYWETKPGCK